ncbi:hypothetical protein NQ315_017211 [Exocentrus adspersus]|uniref:Glutamate receptor 1 n=1 Tax=Exocentrus adspersus TaxID=1586481 RepID=A0AAV8V963_9CUCU|nr:hypothetical protein NQ315_017211 [Exocentrus adspersus]
MKRSYRGIVTVLLLLVPIANSRKAVHVAIFLDDDGDDSELSTIAVASALRRTTFVQVSDFTLKPHIYWTNKDDVLKVGDTVCSLLENQSVAAMFGAGSPEINEIIQSTSTALHIPYFQTFWNTKLSSYNDEFPVFNLHPSPDVLSKALATLVRINAWKTYTVIYEDDDGLYMLQEALKQRSPTDPPVAFKKLGEPGKGRRSVLKEIKSTGVLDFILDCKVDHIFDILREAKEHKLLSEYHSYTLTNLDAHTLDWSTFRDLESNITTFRLVNTTRRMVTSTMAEWTSVLGYNDLIDVKDPVLNNELERLRHKTPPVTVNANKVRVKTMLLYDALNLFLTVLAEQDAKQELNLAPVSCDESTPSLHGRRIVEAVRQKDFKKGVLLDPLTGPISEFSKSGQRLNCQLEVMEFAPKSVTSSFRTVALWKSSSPDQVEFEVTSTSREEEEKEVIQGKNFRVVSRLGAPYLMQKANPNNEFRTGNDRYEGYAMDLMGMICKPESLNCSYTFYLVPDNNYGTYDPEKKQWNGLIRELMDLKADLAICDLTITYERKQEVDFTVPFMTLGISILYAKAVKEPPALLSFMLPLSLDVWLYTATAYLVVSMIIFLVARINPNDWENPHPCDPNPKELENIWNIKNCLWLTLGSIMAQGCDILPKGISTRMVTSMWWFFSLIMTACYTANMAAFLTMERMGPTIESAEDLAAQNKIQYGCVKGGSTAAFFRDTNFSTYHRMWVAMESAEPSVFMASNKDGVKKVTDSKRKYAFLMESSSIEYETEGNCDLMQVGNLLDSKGYGIAMPMNARYRKPLNRAVLRLQEMGELLRLKDKWWKELNRGGQCTRDKDAVEDTAAELGLDHVGGVFVVLAGGVCVALVIAICEFFWNVRKVAVVEHLSVKEAFYKELKFAMNIWARQKKVMSSPSSREISLN